MTGLGVEWEGRRRGKSVARWWDRTKEYWWGRTKAHRWDKRKSRGWEKRPVKGMAAGLIMLRATGWLWTNG